MTNEFDYLGAVLPDKKYIDNMPAGTYQVVVDNVRELISKNNNFLLITTFKTILDNETVYFKYFKVIPTTEITNKDKFKSKLFYEYLKALGVSSLTQLSTIINNSYTCDISYTGNFMDIKIKG